MKRSIVLLGSLLMTWAAVAQSNDEVNTNLDYAQVVAVEAIYINGAWTFSVAVHHNDEGWEHYANVWQVINPETGDVLGERVLLHPHDNEQPFTRSQSGIKIGPHVDSVTVRAKCMDHDYGGQELVVNLSPGSVNEPEVTVIRK